MRKFKEASDTTRILVLSMRKKLFPQKKISVYLPYFFKADPKGNPKNKDHLKVYARCLRPDTYTFRSEERIISTDMVPDRDYIVLEVSDRFEFVRFSKNRKPIQTISKNR